MRKTLIYLVLEIRSVFLCAKNSARLFFSGPKSIMANAIRTFLILFVLLTATNFESYAQNNCEPGERFCRGDCRPVRECRQGVPPPPGLPLDSKIPFLIIAGLGLGIYYVRSRKAV